MLLDTSQVTVIDCIDARGATIVPVGAALIDDGHDRVRYQDLRSAVEPNATRSFYYGGLQHSTIIPGDIVTFSFLGTAVWYVSDKHAENGWAKISVDGGEEELFSQVMCWSKTGLSPGEHTVHITHSDSSGKYISLDFLSYMPSVKKSGPTGLIAGVASGATASFLMIICAAYLIWKRRQAHARRESGNPELTGEATLKTTAEASTTAHLSTVSYDTEPWSSYTITPSALAAPRSSDYRQVLNAANDMGKTYSGLSEI
ncbi:hypothetical protein RhiJN_07773 [Ceratobasidium sp. AG-Ba]|nr:hypothetical protein RhiJN_07773 [Ceratobasidium sp. AG-Ba]QRW08608.1 hypothetical protein RhiLY_07607 [Ceratobasidium sp. AG-Ba]